MRSSETALLVGCSTSPLGATVHAARERRAATPIGGKNTEGNFAIYRGDGKYGDVNGKAVPNDEYA